MTVRVKRAMVFGALLMHCAIALPTVTSEPQVLAATLPDSLVKTTPQAALPLGGPSFLSRDKLKNILGDVNPVTVVQRDEQVLDTAYDDIAQDMIGGIRVDPLGSSDALIVNIGARQNQRTKALPGAVDGILATSTASADASRRTKALPGTTVANSTSTANGAARNNGTVQQSIASTCVGSNANDTYISSLFYYGGAGTTVYLCPNAKISLTNAIFFTAANQTLATQGFPTGSTRATLTVTAPDQSCAIYALLGDGFDNVTLRSVIIDGSRPTLGRLADGIALIEMGGNSLNQQILNVKAFEPRGWSAVHAIEGTNNYCNGMKILNNQVGPAGNAPTGPAQFRNKRQQVYPPGQWADGISMACKNSVVTGNTITDATDGGIVIFGAPGSTVSNNWVIAASRQLLGGINMVDWSPFSGSFVGTKVSNNYVMSQGAMIKLGIAMGGMTWGVDNRTAARTYGGSVTNNNFYSNAKAYFGYAIGIAGHENATISGNNAMFANFGGVSSPSCFPQFPLPAFQPFVADQWTTPGTTFQSGFNFGTLVLLICSGPGAITRRFGF